MGKDKTTSRDSRQDRVNRALAAEMLRRGASYRAITAATGVSSSTIAKIAKGDLEPDWTIVADLEAGERNKLTLLVDQLVTAAMNPDRIEAAKLSEVATALNVAIHSRQLLSGRPTEIREYRTMSVGDLLKLREEMLKKAGVQPGDNPTAPQAITLEP